MTKNLFHLKSVTNFFNIFILLISMENIFQWVYKPCLGFILFFLACLDCVCLLASNVMTSAASNMHSLVPYYIKIQAVGLLWNNSIHKLIQEQHHKTKNIFIFCLSTAVYTSVPAPSCRVKMHDEFVRSAPSLLLCVLLYLCASFWFLSQLLQF